MALPVAAGALSAAAAPAAPVAAHATGATGSAIQQTTASAVPNVVLPASTPRSPHTGTLDVYEILPGGSNTEDPSVAYDTGSYEAILNVYQTLVNYNGNSTDTFVPTLAVCVPGTPQCSTDYPGFTGIYDQTGAVFTGGVGQLPTYWTYVIDKQASFYDPTTTTSWGVYPSDVMFSLARTIAFADQPYVGKQPGWIQAQALTDYDYGGGFDGGIHTPFDNTPAGAMSHMLVNDTNYCPAAAISGEHGCITFVATGSFGLDWPFFNQLVADNLGASIEPCGWFNYEHAAMPGWGVFHTSVSHGDSSCLLPGSTYGLHGVATHAVTSTMDPAWTAYLGSVSPYLWDPFENATATTPVVDPGVQWNMVGSGPYYAGIIPGSAYSLRVNPAYLQPSGCSGAGGIATYGGYCDPAPHGYIGSVDVYWEPDDSFGISQYQSGQADFAGIEATHTTTLLLLAAEGKLNYYVTPTISNFFTPINLWWSQPQYTSQYPSNPVPTIPANFFTNLALREFYIHAYPYLTVENTIRTVDGIQYTFNSGGPIPYGMAGYPTNISFASGDPYHPSTDPNLNPSTVGGATWWWAQANNPSSPWYDAQLAACTHATPCTWAIAGLQGDPSDDQGIADWINEIVSITGGALVPYGGSSFDLTFDQFLDVAFTSAYNNPLVSEVGTGWAPDYPDPTDYVAPEGQPANVYTEADAFGQQLGVTNSGGWDANNTTCGHSAITFADLAYWAHAANNPAGGLMSGVCQGVAYGVANAYFGIAASLPVGPTRNLDYNLGEQILNGEAMYVWNGQSNEVLSAAPWISGSSLNTNVMIGGGGDQIWFHIAYAPYQQAVTFKESGLPSGQTWSVNAGSPASTKTDTTTGTGGSVLYAEPNGTLGFTVTPPAGYGVALIVGPHGTTFGSAPITTTTTITVKFGLLEPLTFTEVPSVAWPGMPGGTTWGINLIQVGAGPASAVGTTTGTVVSFMEPQGAHFKYTVSKPSIYTASPKKGSVAMPGAAKNVNEKFKANVAKITFAAHALAAHTSWSVSVTGPSPSVAVQTLSGTTATLKFALVNGSYTYTIPLAGNGASPAPASGAFVVVAPHAQTIAVTFTPQHASFAPGAVTRLADGLLSHSNLVATVTGREAA
ncbi:MAG: hypothetical protein ACLQD8_00040 [Thermoplasmata archaeon]